MEDPPAVIELKKRPIPEQLRILADSLQPVLQGVVGVDNYCAVLGTMTLLQVIADELEQGSVAQSVERGREVPSVGGSIPS